jgi:hypothetical protein
MLRARTTTSLRVSIFLAVGIAPSGCAPTVNVDCSDATPLDNGLVDCGGVQVRQEPSTCALPPEGDGETTCAAAYGCKTDADCTDGANGRCLPDSWDCGCRYGCETDGDCTAGNACLCEEGGGFCVAAACFDGGACGDEQWCALYVNVDACENGTTSGFACTTAEDECAVDADCDEGMDCEWTGDRFACSDNTCFEGRPFFVDGELRTATRSDGSAWGTAMVVDLAIDAEVRSALARRWERIGQLEHASVAAFARFAMQLLALGAPPELVTDTTRAMADETAHARLAFGLASAYAGRPLGPGPLAIDGALADSGLEAVVRTLFAEGCVGETFAAALAQLELARSTDGAVRSVLGRIAVDEERHSLLAWRSLAWLLDTRGEPVRALVRDEIARVEAELDVPAPTERRASARAEAQGVLGKAEMHRLRHEVLREVVLPAASALLERGEARGRPVRREPERTCTC